MIAEQALKFVRDNKARPFFLYVPTTIPHLALQAPEDALKEYDGAFPDDPPYVGGSYLPHRTPRAAYAAMVTRMDAHVGPRLFDDNDLKASSAFSQPIADHPQPGDRPFLDLGSLGL